MPLGLLLPRQIHLPACGGMWQSRAVHRMQPGNVPISHSYPASHISAVPFKLCAPGFTYVAESGFLEMLLQSEHRTLDPEEAGERRQAVGQQVRLCSVALPGCAQCGLSCEAWLPLGSWTATQLLPVIALSSWRGTFQTSPPGVSALPMLVGLPSALLVLQTSSLCQSLCLAWLGPCAASRTRCATSGVCVGLMCVCGGDGSTARCVGSGRCGYMYVWGVGGGGSGG